MRRHGHRLPREVVAAPGSLGTFKESPLIQGKLSQVPKHAVTAEFLQAGVPCAIHPLYLPSPWVIPAGLAQAGGDSSGDTVPLVPSQPRAALLGPVSASCSKDSPKGARVTARGIIRGQENMSYWEALGVT